MKTIKNTSLYFFASLLVFKLFVFGAIFTFSPDFLMDVPSARTPASGDKDCIEAVKTIVSDDVAKKIDVDPSIAKDASKKFWTQKNGTFIGASYFKAKKAVFHKVKLFFMDINSNFRPIYYIEEDEASYPKIFKFIESKAKHAGGDDEELSGIEKEIAGWMISFKSYTADMENLVSEYAVLSAYVDKIRELKKDKYIQFPFEVEMKLLKDGKEQVLTHYAANQDDLSNIIFILKGKMKKLKGTSYFRFGAIDTRDLEQALLSSRLKSLENEIANHIAGNPNDKELFAPLLKELREINRNSEYTPTLKFAAKLEYNELNAEYKDLFKNAEVNYDKIDKAAQQIIQKLSPKYQEKLGLNAVKNWVSVMKAGRAGVLIGGVGTLGTGFGALALRGWAWLSYDSSSKDGIIYAEDDEAFSTNLKKYLKGKYPADLIRRIEKKNDNEMTLKNFNPKNDEEVEILQLVNGIIVERKKIRTEEKLLEDLEKKLSTAIEGISDTAQVKLEDEGEKVDKKPTRKPLKPKPTTKEEDSE